MKNKIIILSISIMGLISCKEMSDKETGTRYGPKLIRATPGVESNNQDRDYVVYTLEECEYIVASPGNSHFTWGSHKGNCKNPIHGKDQRNDSTIEDQKRPEYKNALENEIKKEKHFDCYVESAVKERSLKGVRWYITTECGVSFYSQHYYSVGSALKGFKSLKHK